MDLTLTYWLTKAHLGSLALEPEYSASASVAKVASQDPKLLQAQSKIITIAKVSALAALNLAISQVGFLDRLVYLPSYYHFVRRLDCGLKVCSTDASKTLFFPSSTEFSFSDIVLATYCYSFNANIDSC